MILVPMGFSSDLPLTPSSACVVVLGLEPYLPLGWLPSGQLPNQHFDDTWLVMNATAVQECFGVLYIAVSLPC